MPDENKPDDKSTPPTNTPDPSNTPAGGGINDGGNNGGQGLTGATNSGAEEKQFTQADLDRIAQKVRDEEKKRQEKAAEEAKRKADEEAAIKAGEWQKLAEQRAIEIESLKSQIAELKNASLRSQVASKFKLPTELAARLFGSTESELEEDAKKLAKLVVPPSAPDTEAGRRDTQTPTSSEEELARRKRDSGAYVSF